MRVPLSLLFSLSLAAATGCSGEPPSPGFVADASLAADVGPPHDGDVGTRSDADGGLHDDVDVGTRADADVAPHDAGSPVPRAGSCPIDGVPRTAAQIEGLIQAVPDLTGDGRDDFLVRTPTSLDLMAGPTPGTTHISLATLETSFQVATGDLNQDGVRDLVVSTPWSHQVAVFFGPISPGASSLRAAPLLISDPPMGFLSRFGLGVHVHDVTDDGSADLIIGAAAETEEACLGTDDTVVFIGPLGPGRLTAADAPIRIAAANAPCLGFPIVTGVDIGEPARPVLVLGGFGEAVWFDLPLTDLPAVAGRRPGRGELAAVKHLDGDARIDFVFQGSIVYGDGRAADFTFEPTLFAHVFEGVSWTTAGIDVFVALSSVAESTVRRLVDGVVSFEALPIIAQAESRIVQQLSSSTGDLDGDGLTDLVLSDRLIRCTPR